MGPHPFLLFLLSVDLIVGCYVLGVLLQLIVNMLTRWGGKLFLRNRGWPKLDYRCIATGTEDEIPLIDRFKRPTAAEQEEYWDNFSSLFTTRRYYIMLALSIIGLFVVGYFFGLGPVTYFHLAIHILVLAVIHFFLWLFVLDTTPDYKEMKRQQEIEAVKKRFEYKKMN